MPGGGGGAGRVGRRPVPREVGVSRPRLCLLVHGERAAGRNPRVAVRLLLLQVRRYGHYQVLK